MNKWLILLLLLVSSAQANDIVSLGLTGFHEPTRNRFSLSVGETNYFDQHSNYMDVIRYGYGYFKVNIGNGFGIDTHSYGGATLIGLKDDQEGFMPHVGLDFANLWARLDTNANSYYGWAPGISVGPQIGSRTTRLLILAKGGVYAGNINMGTFWPHFRWSYGAAAHLSSTRFSVNFDMLMFNENSYKALDVYYNFSKWFRVGVHAEEMGGIQQMSIMFKSDALP